MLMLLLLLMMVMAMVVAVVDDDAQHILGALKPNETNELAS